MLSIIVGYPVCHAVLGPIILSKRGKRRLIENYLYFGNIIQMENDMKALSEHNDKTALFVYRLITVCKWSIIINLILVIAFAVIATQS
jgi:hypothetical protein